jgi:hypothetical protein
MQEQGCFPEAGARGNADERAFPTPWTVGTGSDRPIRASAATAAHHGAPVRLEAMGFGTHIGDRPDVLIGKGGDFAR